MSNRPLTRRPQRSNFRKALRLFLICVAVYALVVLMLMLLSAGSEELPFTYQIF
ncbi:MAG: hypothetical protein GY769_23765 [bacterium]|nr:hypothetical protein [bacterium]